MTAQQKIVISKEVIKEILVALGAEVSITHTREKEREWCRLRLEFIKDMEEHWKEKNEAENLELAAWNEFFRDSSIQIN